ncbi:MAG TPA: EamA family transporter [archaeon]|nr:EamA family transporter [archaeon]
MEMVILAAFCAMLLWGAADFLIQRLCRKIGNLETLLLIDFSAAILLLPIVWNDFGAINQSNLPLLIALGAIGWFSGVVSFEALNKGKLSVVDAILVLELPVTIILGIYFFQDAISSLQWALIAAVLIGTILVSLATLSAKKILANLEKGAAIALAAAFIFGVMNFTTAAVARDVTPILAIWFPWTISMFVTAAIMAKRKSLFGTVRKVASAPWLSLFTALCATFGWAAYAIAVEGGELSIITAITESYVVIAVLMGVLVNREKLAPHQMVAVIGVIAASIWLGMSA